MVGLGLGKELQELGVTRPLGSEWRGQEGAVPFLGGEPTACPNLTQGPWGEPWTNVHRLSSGVEAGSPRKCWLCALAARAGTLVLLPCGQAGVLFLPSIRISAHEVSGDESLSLEGAGQSVSQPSSFMFHGPRVRQGPGGTDAEGPGALWSP